MKGKLLHLEQWVWGRLWQCHQFLLMIKQKAGIE